jgi:hypothetical protein
MRLLEPGSLRSTSWRGHSDSLFADETGRTEPSNANSIVEPTSTTTAKGPKKKELDLKVSDCNDDARDKLGAGIDQVVVGGLGKRTECRQVYIPIQEAVVAHLVRMDRQDLLPPFLVRKPDLHLDLKPTRPNVEEKRPWLSTCTFKKSY